MHRASAGAILVLSAPLLHWVRARIPVPASAARRTTSPGFLASPTFWALQASNVLEGLGLFLPPHTSSPLLLLPLNASSVPGQIVLGALSDRVHIIVLLVPAAGTTLSVLSWELAVFATTYFFCTSTYAGVCREVVKVNPRVEVGMLASGRGVGNVVTGLLSEVLLRQWSHRKQAGSAYGSKFVD